MRQRLKSLHLIGSALTQLMPFVLWFGSGVLLESISDYHNVCPMIFTAYLCFSSCVYFLDGWMNRDERWFNCAFAVLLMCVLVFDMDQFPKLHYTSAGLFFLGNISAVLFSKGLFSRDFRILFSSILLAIIALRYCFNYYSTFWMEIYLITILSVLLLAKVYKLKIK